jgi:hypothetical protein
MNILSILPSELLAMLPMLNFQQGEEFFNDPFSPQIEEESLAYRLCLPPKKQTMSVVRYFLLEIVLAVVFERMP